MTAPQNFQVQDPFLETLTQLALSTPSTPENVGERITGLWAWMLILQQCEADMTDFLEDIAAIEATGGDLQRGLLSCVDRAYRRLFPLVSLLRDETVETHGADPTVPSPSSDRDRDWPVYGGNASHTAHTSAPGPTQGRIAWTGETGYGWGAAPLVRDGRVYTSAPGMRVRAWCRDLRSGEMIWAAPRLWPDTKHAKQHVFPQSYVTPALASSLVETPVGLAALELGPQNRDGMRSLRVFDSETGEEVSASPAGHADYRMGTARMGGGHGILAYTDGVQVIRGQPNCFFAHHRVVCAKDNGEKLWDFPVGPVFAEPVSDGTRVYVGTEDGLVFGLRVQGAAGERGFGMADEDRMAWVYRAGAAVNVRLSLNGNDLLFGSNDGVIHCLDRETGLPKWTRKLCGRESRCFQLFSPVTVSDDRVYVGSATRTLFCLDRESGSVRWEADTPHWIRSAPFCLHGRVVCAGVDGTVQAFRDGSERGEELWRCRPAGFGVYADLAGEGEHLVYTDSALTMRCIHLQEGALCWAHPLLIHAKVNGRWIRADEHGCGGVHQSKPTAADGMVYVGAPCRFVFAFDAESGQEKWRYEMSGAISGAPAVTPDGGLLVGQQGGSGEFLCLNAATGEPRWKQTLGWVWSSANIEGNKAYIPSVDGYFNCLDTSTGQIIWRYRSAAGAHPEPPVDQGRVFFGSWDHFVYAFDAENGDLLWKFACGGTPDSGAPIAVDGLLIVPMGGKRLCVLDAATGAIQWEWRPQTGCMNASPALWGRHLLVSMSAMSGAVPPKAEIRCLNLADGKLRWTHPGGGITAPAVAGDLAVIPSTASNRVHGIRLLADGSGFTPLWSVRLGARVYESVPAIHRGKAFVLAEDGFLYAIV
ncbi:MAG: PQQ-binding-like beta-propeller repeat protein [Verrucomicrobia bacterium]|nr:PQQ-binding-like beta-propeller repeat protein [Verrucomicrobiota bacterium]MCH8510811.1 PQQ-binding-like beta-propeller repeat protein [Kiritimatiellia bacterium]